MAEPDISKIINVIMENPKLIDEIRTLMDGEKSDKEDVGREPGISEEASAKALISEEAPKRKEEPTYPKSKSSRRTELLRAMKPYVNEERSKAIETMITVADILLAVKER